MDIHSYFLRYNLQIWNAINGYDFTSSQIVIDDAWGETKVVTSHMNLHGIATPCIVESYRWIHMNSLTRLG